MIWFGGLGGQLSDSVFLATLELKFSPKTESEALSKREITWGLLSINRLKNRAGKLVTLQRPDRFFYNQEFYLPEPTERMVEMGLGYTGRYQSTFFNRNRFIGVIGRHAFHVFDLEEMDFLYADEDRGYVVNLDPAFNQK